MSITLISTMKNKILLKLKSYQETWIVTEYRGGKIGVAIVEGLTKIQKNEIVLIGPHKVKAISRGWDPKKEKDLYVVILNPAERPLVKCGDKVVRSESELIMLTFCFLDFIQEHVLRLGLSTCLILFLFVMREYILEHLFHIFDYYLSNTKPPIIQNEIVPTITNTTVNPSEIMQNKELPIDKKPYNHLVEDIAIGTVAIVVVYLAVTLYNLCNK